MTIQAGWRGYCNRRNFKLVRERSLRPRWEVALNTGLKLWEGEHSGRQEQITTDVVTDTVTSPRHPHTLCLV